MKHLATIGFLALSLSAGATDRIVEEFGSSPTYPSINAAVTAAVDGDRVVVKNRAGNIPWIEDITVNKSLQFLSYANNDFFYVQGTYSIVPTSGREVTIIGMRNTAGSVQAGAGTAAVRGTRVRVIDSYFVNGAINLANQYYDGDVVGCTLLSGTVSLYYGSVVGSDIDGSTLNDEAISITGNVGGFALDTCAIIGNKVKGRVGYDAVFVSGVNQVFHIRNNYVQHGWSGINAYDGNTSAVPNLIWNNTVTAYTGNFSTYGILIANTSAGSIWEVMNNAVTTTWNGDNRGIWKDSGNNGQLNVYFNHVTSAISPSFAVSTTFTFAQANTTSQPLTLNADGSLNNAPGCVDGANPAAVFSDLDLSTGDAGAYGGSYTLNNFFPLHTGAARTYMTGHPFNIRQGSTLRVKAVAFDR
ncbi:MAG: hypothetical protein IT229_05540 [Flavobacteriales bacterium]|nr:hypothetical protein [Flavobacteriales bacterium]